MYLSNADKAKLIILNIAAKYLVWIVMVAVIILWWFYPSLMMTLGKILMFWAPAIILVFGFMVGIFKIRFKAKRDKEQGISEYNISLNENDFYLVDLLIYGGCLLILMTALIFDDNGVSAYDLIQALIYFALANQIKNVFYKKILY